jgi:hypothetical protein
LAHKTLAKASMQTITFFCPIAYRGYRSFLSAASWRWLSNSCIRYLQMVTVWHFPPNTRSLSLSISLPHWISIFVDSSVREVACNVSSVHTSLTHIVTGSVFDILTLYDSQPSTVCIDSAASSSTLVNASPCTE